LLVLEVLLLRANHAAGANDAEPGDGLVGGEAQVFHHVHGNQCAGAPKAREAVHG
jgi:hypothetical protein